MAEEEPTRSYNEKFLKSWESTVIAFEMASSLLCFGTVMCGQWSWCSGCWIISFLLMLCSILSFMASSFVFLHQMFIPIKEGIRNRIKRKINWKSMIIYQCWISSSGLFVASVLQSLFSGMIAAFQISSVFGFLAYKLYAIHGFFLFYKLKAKKGRTGDLSESESDDDSSEGGVMGVVVKNELTFNEDTPDCSQPQLSRIRHLSDASQTRKPSTETQFQNQRSSDSPSKTRHVSFSPSAERQEDTSDVESKSDNMENSTENLVESCSGSENDLSNSYDFTMNKL